MLLTKKADQVGFFRRQTGSGIVYVITHTAIKGTGSECPGLVHLLRLCASSLAQSIGHIDAASTGIA